MPSFEGQLNSEADKLPTVKQWMNSVSAEATIPTRIIKVIWTPNLYPSYSLDTEAYRVRVADTHFLYQVLEQNLETWIESGTVLGLNITGKKVIKVTLLTLDKEEGEWDALGEHGWKFSNLKTKKKSKT